MIGTAMLVLIAGKTRVTRETHVCPDITMCPGTDCPLKETCYRYTAKPTQFSQSYFVDPPIKDGECDYFWDNGPRAA